MSDDENTHEGQPSELEREERRLERLRLVAISWPAPESYDEEPPAAA